MKQLLHTPEGVRDIYNKECKKKIALQDKLLSMLHLYGYHDIQTPTFEFFDVFRKEIGTIESKELYKFFDREGNTLVLRPDITPSVARAAATLFEEEDAPIRLCYIGNTFINHSSYKGRLKENTQIGAELIGLDGLDADAEMLAMVVDGLKSVGLEEFQVNVGHVDFINSLMEATNLPEEEKAEVRELIANRNFFGVDEVLDEHKVEEQVKEAFRILPELMGGADVLERAAQIAPNEAACQAVSHLQQIYQTLELYGAEQHISFDLSMSGSYGYYTGIIFRAYTYGTGDAIVRGGRYNKVLEKFGKQAPSIGFGIIVDELMNALSRQKISMSYEHTTALIVYSDATQKWAIKLARDFRAKKKAVELLKRTEPNSKEDYIAYGKRNFALSMLYLEDDFKMEMVNLVNGTAKVIDCNK
ncbi:MAG: ATP phosphoribosyltransferase regulatory subunit [Hespellia sp.]|nr:ATP phosphoribosyltransferase regulatory subunit [Hespellia sp.]